MVEPIHNIYEDVIDGAPIKEGGIEAWHNKNRTLYARLDGISNQGIAWINARNKTTHRYKQLNDGKPDVAQEELELYPFEIPGSSFSDAKIEMLKKTHSCMMKFYEKVNQVIPGEQYYREKACLDCMNQIERIVEESSEKSEYDDLDQAGYIISLMRILLFHDDSNSFEKQLSHWISRLGSIQLDKDGITAVIQSRQAYRKEEFWDFIYRLAANGINVICDECLAYAFEDQDITSDVAQCLDYINQLLSSHARSVESTTTFMTWRQGVINAGQQAQSIDDAYLKEKFIGLLNILRGDAVCLSQATNNWYEMIGSLVRYCDPSKELLASHCQTALNHSKTKKFDSWEKAAIHLFKGELLLAIQSLEIIDFSLAAIVSELLDKRGVIDSIYGSVDIETNSIFQWLILTHCHECLDQSDESLIISTLDFLECKLHDLFDSYEKNIDTDEETLFEIKEYAAKIYGLIAEYIPHAPIRDFEILEWAVRKSEQFASHDVTLQLFGIYARSLSDEGRYYEALAVLDKSGDANRMSRLCWSMFELVAVNCQPIGDEMTNQMVKSGPPLFSPELRSCVSYFAVVTNLVMSLRSEQWQGAAELVMSLIRVLQGKSKYLALLMMMILPIAKEAKRPVFTRNDVFLLMRTIDELEQPTESMTLLGRQLVMKSLANRPEQHCHGDWRFYFNENDKLEHIFYVVRHSLALQSSQALLG